MDILNCKTDKEKITVGEHVQLTCSGSLKSEFSAEKSEFKLDESHKYSLKLFSTKSVGSDTVIDFTIYSPADYKIDDLVLTDGANEIKLSGSTIKVESVLQPSQDGKPPEPFGSILPIGIGTPVYYYLLAVIFIALLTAYFIYNAKRYSYYKKLKEGLKKYESPIDPDTQFYKSIRIAEKSGYPIDQVEKSFRLYNLRAYQLPMFDLPDERIQRYFKRNFPEYKKTRAQLIRVLDELTEMQKRKEELTLSEKQEFIKKLYRFVENNRGLQS